MKKIQRSIQRLQKNNQTCGQIFEALKRQVGMDSPLINERGTGVAAGRSASRPIRHNGGGDTGIPELIRSTLSRPGGCRREKQLARVDFQPRRTELLGGLGSLEINQKGLK